MAAFLVRALGYVDDGGGDLFFDDDGSVFEGDIDRLATVGVTNGCDPPVNNKFCPDDFVTRGQMQPSYTEHSASPAHNRDSLCAARLAARGKLACFMIGLRCSRTSSKRPTSR